MRAIKIDPDERVVEAIDFPDELNTPLSALLHSPTYVEVDAAEDHVLLLGQHWDQEGPHRFQLDQVPAASGTALLLGKARDTWSDATWEAEAVRERIQWIG